MLMRVYVHTYMYAYMGMYTLARALAHIHVCTLCMHTFKRVRTLYACTHSNVYALVCKHTHIPTCTNVYAYLHMYTYPYAHTHTHTHTNAHTHTHNHCNVPTTQPKTRSHTHTNTHTHTGQPEHPQRLHAWHAHPAAK